LWRRANFGRPAKIATTLLDTLLDDADSSGMAAGSDRAAEAGSGGSPRASR